jgi:hypothetical protein
MLEKWRKKKKFASSDDRKETRRREDAVELRTRAARSIERVEKGPLHLKTLFNEVAVSG